MKKLLIIMLSLTMALGASAQHYYHSHVVVTGGYYPYYSPFYPYYYGLGYPYPYGYPYYSTPTRLDRKTDGIKNDYQQRIWAVKHDKSLLHKERREKIRQLKHERDAATLDARRNYNGH